MITKDDIIYQNEVYDYKTDSYKEIYVIEASKVADELEQIRLELVNDYSGYALDRVVSLLKILRSAEEKKEGRE